MEENTFEIIIPIDKVPMLQVGGTQDGTHRLVQELIAQNPKITRKAMAEQLNVSRFWNMVMY